MNFYSWLFSLRGVACDGDSDKHPKNETLAEHKLHCKAKPDNCPFEKKAVKEAEQEDSVSAPSASSTSTKAEQKPSETPKERADREYQEIVARYTNPDGTKKDGWLKAPNGKDSNLNERQWVQVRTQSFKDWFGDWENDPANASKIVDENGEPKVVYHGAKEPGFLNICTANGIGAWFASDATLANECAGRDAESAIESSIYEFLDDEDDDAEEEEHDDEESEKHEGGAVYQLFLNIRNPIVYDFEHTFFDNGFYPAPPSYRQEEDDESSYPMYRVRWKTDRGTEYFFDFLMKSNAEKIASIMDGKIEDMDNIGHESFAAQVRLVSDVERGICDRDIELAEEVRKTGNGDRKSCYAECYPLAAKDLRDWYKNVYGEKLSDKPIDGLIYKNIKDCDAYYWNIDCDQIVNFDSRQSKSATDNNGVFSRDDTSKWMEMSKAENIIE